ncbi:MAG TPA: indole-3-glycerol phosphate synthase TrpC [Gemmatimonadales bacterium]|nr:indole-3-glycerol phosphate synthase TrpC [Gemmatimonadales bacterium]
MPTLSGILETTRASIPALQKRKTEIEAKAKDAPDPPVFLGGRDFSRLALIAEVKRRSPSAGDIAPSLDPVSHAEAYAQAGAVAISVLTDGPYFGGSLDDLRAVARKVRIPVLRKDFIVDELQIAEARGAGASAILLIVRALSPALLAELGAAARQWGLAALVEVHDEPELGAALAGGARLIGVNSRNLDTFAVDTRAAWTLFHRIPKDIVAVAESGMATPDDVRAAAEAGADAVLIGTALSAAPDPVVLAAQFTSVPRRGR